MKHIFLISALLSVFLCDAAASSSSAAVASQSKERSGRRHESKRSGRYKNVTGKFQDLAHVHVKGYDHQSKQYFFSRDKEKKEVELTGERFGLLSDIDKKRGRSQLHVVSVAAKTPEALQLLTAASSQFSSREPVAWKTIKERFEKKRRELPAAEGNFDYVIIILSLARLYTGEVPERFGLGQDPYGRWHVSFQEWRSSWMAELGGRTESHHCKRSGLCIDFLNELSTCSTPIPQIVQVLLERGQWQEADKKLDERPDANGSFAYISDSLIKAFDGMRHPGRKS